MRFTLLSDSDDDLDLAGSILGPDASVERVGASLVGDAEEALLEELASAGLMIMADRDQQAEGSTSASHSALLELFAADETLPANDHDAARVYQSATISVPLTPDRLDFLKVNGLDLGRRLGPSRYAVKVNHDMWSEYAAPAWLVIGPYTLGDTIGGTQLKLPAKLPTTNAHLESLIEVLDDTTFIDDGPDESFLDADANVDVLRVYEVRCHEATDLGALRSRLVADARVTEVELGETRLRVTANDPDRTFFMWLAELDIVELATDYVPMTLDVSFATAVVAGGPPRPAGLIWNGRGELIGIADSGIDQQHPDFQGGRLEVKLWNPPPSPRDPCGHGTHVSSIAAGDGSASGGILMGMAPGAKLYVQSLLNDANQLTLGVDGIKPLLEDAYKAGVRIQNFSFGAGVEGRYTIDAGELDEFVRTHEDMLVVVACGNDGAQDTSVLPQGESPRIKLRSLASPACAKNCLSVGATSSSRQNGPYESATWSDYDGKNPPERPPMSVLKITGNPGVVAPLSARGPTDDGRLKPDIVAPGVSIAAARSAESTPKHLYPDFDDKYCYKTGTSMAAPLVAGAAAVLRQYFREEKKHEASAALLKACLINSAQWLSGQDWEDDAIGQPNFHQGYGQFSLERILPISDEKLKLLFHDVRNGTPDALHHTRKPRWSLAVTVKAGRPLAATMTWMDTGSRGLQHDMELILVSPSGKKLSGNDELKRLGWETREGSNNVKKVVVEAPEAGKWMLNVVAITTLYGNQGFAVAVTGDITGPG
jgi:serine protease AprX